MNFLEDDNGTSFAEYGLLLAVICCAAILVMKWTGVYILWKYLQIGAMIDLVKKGQGEGY